MTEYSNDAFLSHSGADKPAVERIAATLEKQGVKCFLDKWDILPGDQWMRNLENELSGSRTILIFFGTNGIGPYQQAEADAALRRQIQQRQHCIIPVLLPGASPEHVAQCSLFLQGTNALKFHTLDDPLPHRLLAGLVRAEDPAHLRQWIRAETHASADLLQTLQQWLSGLCFEWRENEYWVSEGQGKRCLNIPDLSGSFNADSIEYLLSWKSRLTDLIGREQELNALHDWADSPNPISSRMITGEGGAGKTRLAFEFARQLREQKGWQAGEAQGLAGCWYTASAGTLLVIDYPEQRPEKVSALLDALARQSLSCKLRVLLLGRNGDFLKQLTQTAQMIMARDFELTGLTAGDSNAWELFQAAWQQLHRRQQLAVPPLPLTESSFQQWQQLNAAHRRPLFVLALAIHRMLQPDARDLSAPVILRELVQQYEINRLVKEAKQLSLDSYSLVMLRALAGISGKLDSAALRQLIQGSETLPLDIRLPVLNQLKQTSLWSQTGIHALQPDLLAADLLHYALTEAAGDQAGAWQYCALAAAADSSEASSILGRLIHDAQFILKRPWPLQSLIDWISRDSERSATVNAALSRNNLERTLLPLAIATAQSAVAIYERLAADNFAAYGPDLAGSLNNLSVRLAESGKRAEGLAAIERAAAIYEQLAQDNFAAHGPDLASSLNNLSNHLAESGKRVGGLAVIERAVAIREQLAQDNFAAYGPDLASSLNNLSVRLADAGWHAEGLAAIERAAAIYEQLAQDNFAAHGPDLAMSLNNLSLRLAERGRRAEGLAAIERTVAIREQLAQDNFAAHGPALAMSLNNLSVRLAESGRRAEGLVAIERAVAICEQLAEDNFAAYGPALASSLNNLSGDLAESGKRAEGLSAIERAVAIYEQLAQDNFAAYGPDLAGSLNNLSHRLAESGRRTEGLAAIERAVAIREQLAQDNFAAHGPDLSMSLNNQSVRLAESGRRAEGLAAIERAVAIREQLAQDNFAAYGPALSMSLNNLSNRLAENGKRAEGLAAIERAVAIREKLAQDNFAAYGPALSMSLNNLSNRLAESGNRAEGLAAIERAVAIREQLAQDNFAAHGPALASSLNNLSNRLGDCTEPTADEAKRLTQIRVRLQHIKRRIRDEHIQVPAHLAWLLESAPEPGNEN